jgi:trk system potassium uptake protein TrkA
MRVAIAGAGIVGRSIARELLENGHEVLLVDKAPSAIKVDSVPTAEWLLADACEMSSLDEAGVARCQVVVAATGDDKVNLVVSLLAKTEYGVPRTVARVNNPKNEWMFNEAWGVDVAGVDAPAHDGPGRGSRERRRPGSDLHLPAVEDEHVRADAARRLADHRPPGGRHPVAAGHRARRGHPRTRPFAPTGDDPLESGDELLFVAGDDVADELEELLAPHH